MTISNRAHPLLAFANFFAKRFGEAIALVKERNQYSESPGGFAMLAANHGHLGQAGLAREALARCRFLTPLPFETLVQVFIDPAQRKLKLDGIPPGREEEPSRQPVARLPTHRLLEQPPAPLIP
jgi:hypothetical protein